MNLLQDQFKAFSSWMEREQIMRYHDQQQRKEEWSLLQELVRANLPKNNQIECVKCNCVLKLCYENMYYKFPLMDLHYAKYSGAPVQYTPIQQKPRFSRKFFCDQPLLFYKTSIQQKFQFSRLIFLLLSIFLLFFVALHITYCAQAYE